ncbi:hypothetical protein EHQ58_02480 [Leptospira ognonensis]|uniref:Mannosyltransferase n=1 Tax=Leptospira ognonensis TaxID=2484945 RepID=A0A4V3JRX2_9LEPT|nr:hypothetical protein [Leptospira ognonensis]TGL62091.1 hypothetical protein EHQ58_02480 [Leptospira ognonensis]
MFYFLSLSYALFLKIFLPFLNRTEWDTFLAFLFVSFSFYFLILRYVSSVSLNGIFGMGIVLRLASLFAIPVLSDDFYRFLWDGFLSFQGSSPFVFTPLEWMTKNEFRHTNLLEIYENLNSKNYYSVYPVILQGIFAIPWILGLENLFYQVVCLQLILFIFDIFNLIIMKAKTKDLRIYWIFVGNPLLVLESASQIHFEGMILFFFFIILSQFQKRRFLISSIIFSIIMQIKINFLFLMPGFMTNRTYPS